MRAIELQIHDIAFGGKGVGRVEGKAVFVPFTIEGERVRARIVREKKNFAEAELLDVLEAAPQRVAAGVPLLRPLRRVQLSTHRLRASARNQNAPGRDRVATARAHRGRAPAPDHPLAPAVRIPQPHHRPRRRWRGRLFSPRRASPDRCRALPDRRARSERRARRTARTPAARRAFHSARASAARASSRKPTTTWPRRSFGSWRKCCRRRANS